MFEFSQNVHVMKFEKYVIACNVVTGSYIKFPESYYNAMISTELNEKEIKKHNDLYKLFCKLIQEKFIVESGYNIEEYTNLETIYFSVTNKCNLNCLHCCTNADSSYNDILPTKIILKIIDKIIKLNPDSICITGGEPMVRKDILKILKYTRDNFKGTITLSTNATLIRTENVESIITCVNNISISLDGYDDDSCSIIRGRGTFQKSCNAIELLHSYNFRNLSLSMVLTNYNVNNKKKFEELCKKYDAEVIFRKLQPLGRGKIIFDEYGKFIRDKDELSVGCRTCFPGKKELHISFDGKVYPCGGTFGLEEFVIANILDDDFDKSIHALMYKNDLPSLSFYRSWNCSNCKKCQVQLFCPICLGEKSVLLNNNCLEEVFCQTFRRNMEERLKKEFMNE